MHTIKTCRALCWLVWYWKNNGYRNYRNTDTLASLSPLSFKKKRTCNNGSPKHCSNTSERKMRFVSFFHTPLCVHKRKIAFHGLLIYFLPGLQSFPLLGHRNPHVRLAALVDSSFGCIKQTSASLYNKISLQQTTKQPKTPKHRPTNREIIN